MLFPFVFQARLHNGQSVTVLTSWKVSSTGVPTRNHTNGASWKQDSSKMKLKRGLKCDLTLQTWMPTIKNEHAYLTIWHKLLHVRNPKQSTLCSCSSRVAILKRRAEAYCNFLAIYYQQISNYLGKTHYETIKMWLWKVVQFSWQCVLMIYHLMSSFACYCTYVALDQYAVSC